MKILIIMDFFPGGGYGGHPVSVDDFCTLMNEDKCFILATNHNLNESERYRNITEGGDVRANCKVKYVTNFEYKSNI